MKEGKFDLFKKCRFCKKVEQRNLMSLEFGTLSCRECEDSAKNVLEYFKHEEKELLGDWLPQIEIDKAHKI